MAIIAPFNAYRYAPNIVKDIDLVVTQPYDRINEALRKEYYQKSPYNLVRIILGYDSGDDYKGRNKYQMAGNYLQTWIKEGALVKEDQPAIYYYTQTFKLETGETRTRSGFIGLGKLDESKVHAHERTLAGPKKDRMSLLKETKAHYGQIFMLYQGGQDDLGKLVGATDTPDVIAHDEDGNIHKMWVITAKDKIQKLQDMMKDKDLFIADGHHRYETAMNFRKEMLEKGEYVPAMDYLQMTFVNMADPGLTILPTHRCVLNLADFQLDKMLGPVKEYFTVTEASSPESMLAEMNKRGLQSHAFGLSSAGKYFVLCLKDEQTMDKLFPEENSPEYRRLDVSILHLLILEKILGITKEDQANEKNLHYVRKYREAVDALAKDECQLAFFLNATKVSEVRDIAGKGERMPQKSTDFYPKLLSGLTIYKLE
ncbi:MAG: DUF1015 domain-containing protein [Candidatus Margulisiibacteriota bacterium]